MTKILVIGGGFAGCIASHMLTDKGYDVTLIEKGPVLGGGCRTLVYGGHPYTIGPRHFLTKKEEVFEFLNQHIPMRRYPDGHEFLTYIEKDQSFWHFPIHRDEVEEMPDREKILEEFKDCPGPEGAKNLEEYWLMSVGPTLYGKFVESYSKKMWQIDSNTEITDFGFTPKGVAIKTGPKGAWTEAISGYPKAMNGYDDYFDISTRNTKVHLNTPIEEYDVENRRVKVAGEWHTYDIIISTIFPEVLMNNAFGPLRWMGRDFFKIVLPVKKVFPENVYFLYYANQEPFTRIVEYKNFYHYDSPTTLLGLEIPSFNNKYYPFPMKADQDRAQQYFDALPKDVYSIGRAGTYRYIDVGNIIEQALEMFRSF
ncbi:UDP-galactopyranose mutase [Paramagnetospirillum caucaseum]|uniref:UDP-galactopyranose mutase n=1 Tax=Paramagnetospirillum caucaseum TaxID=1244869 RepID=M2Z8A0_9PROT|nr:FAD-dependent oxidoreductase [Paramagnetospirillum caucaseum]EME70535.1 UDP-galactopyranose mutase [Paramagnetospirillum caucaseum]